MAGKPGRMTGRETTTRSLLNALAENGPLLTTELLACAPPWEHLDNQHRLTKVGNIMRFNEQRGYVGRAGKTRGGWQRCPIQRWEITPAGRAALAAAAERKAAQERRTLQHLVDHEAQEEAIEAARAAVRAGDIRPYERQEWSVKLRSLGISYQEIADIFGVTRQMIYIDCAIPRRTKPLPGRKWASPSRRRINPPWIVRGPRGRRPLALHALNEDSAMAGMVDVTFTEF